MLITIKDRETLSGVVSIHSGPIDVSDVPLVSVEMLIHAISGTSPDLQVQFQTSNNLEDWDDVGGPVSSGSTGSSRTAYKADTAYWGRYLRAKIALTGTGPLVVYSLFLNTFPSA